MLTLTWLFPIILSKFQELNFVNLSEQSFIHTRVQNRQRHVCNLTYFFIPLLSSSSLKSRDVVNAQTKLSLDNLTSFTSVLMAFTFVQSANELLHHNLHCTVYSSLACLW